MLAQYILYGVDLCSRPIGTELRLVQDTIVDDRTVQLYTDALKNPFLTPMKPVDDPRRHLMVMKKEKEKGEGLPFAKIFLGNYLIGIGFSRKLSDKAMKLYKLDDRKDWYRIGWWYIDQEFQGKGYGVQAMRLFIEKYQNVFYMAESGNIASQKVAIKAGMLHTGSVWSDADSNIRDEQQNFDDKEFYTYKVEAP